MINRPKEPLSGIKLWTNANAKWFVYPELVSTSNYFVPSINNRPSLGIAVSGGGYRAVTLALGYVRALQMMNLTQQAKYLSSNSGGSWFNSAFSYQNNTLMSEFIGPYVPPENLTHDVLKEVKKGAQGAFARTICDATITGQAAMEAAADVVTGSARAPGAWSSAVGDAFLSPYKLNADQSTFSALGTAGPVHTTLSNQLQDLTTYYWQGGLDAQTEGNISRPFPIILGTIFDKVDNQPRFYPFEFTPLYVGCPAVAPDTANPSNTVGGGFVDPAGFNSLPPKPAPVVPKALQASLGQVPANLWAPIPSALVGSPSAAGKRHRSLLQGAAAAPASAAAPPAGGTSEPVKTVAAEGAVPGDQVSAVVPPQGTGSAAAAADVGYNKLLPLETSVNSSFIVPLKIAAGISSSFMAQGLMPANNKALQELTGTEKLDYWNLVNFGGQPHTFADGGGIDNLAVTPLLRRRVEHIVACIAGSEPINGNVNLNNWAAAQWDISGLFGAAPLSSPRYGKRQLVNGMAPQAHNRALQVFPTSEFPKLFKAFKQSSDAGGPAYHLATYTVLDNPYQGMHGGWKPDLTQARDSKEGEAVFETLFWH
eukprot:gene1277-1617_t